VPIAAAASTATSRPRGARVRPTRAPTGTRVPTACATRAVPGPTRSSAR
jgi:hypothetical protein